MRWVDRVELEFANLRSAADYALGCEDTDLALRLVAALYDFAFHRLRDEVFTWAERAAALPRTGQHPLFAVVLGVAGIGQTIRGDRAEALALAERALAASTEPDDPRRLLALHVLAVVALYEGRLDDCRRWNDEGLRLTRIHGDWYHHTFLWTHEALALAYGGDSATAQRVAADQVRLARRLRNPSTLAWALYSQGETVGDSDPARALSLLDEAVRLAETVGNRFVAGVARVSATSLGSRHGPPQQALRAFREVVRHWQRAGDWTHQWTTLRNLVELLTRTGAFEAAATLYGAVTSASTAAPVFGRDAERLATLAETLRAGLGETAFTLASGRGGQIADEDAVRLALREIDQALAADG